MNLRISCLSCFLVSVAIGIASSAANAVTFTPLPNFDDNDLRAARGESGGPVQFEEDWVGEGRIANNSTNGDVELFLNNYLTNSKSVVAAQDQRVWPNGAEVDFKLEYNTSGSGTVTYTVGGNKLTASNMTEPDRFDPGTKSMYIRTRANDDGSMMQLSDLAINGQSYSGGLIADDSDSLNYLLVSDISDRFTLTGKATFSWVKPSPPTGSRIAFQFKVGSTPGVVGGNPSAEIPEPVSISFFSLGVLGLAAGRRQKNAKNPSELAHL